MRVYDVDDKLWFNLLGRLGSCERGMELLHTRSNVFTTLSDPLIDHASGPRQQQQVYWASLSSTGLRLGRVGSTAGSSGVLSKPVR